MGDIMISLIHPSRMRPEQAYKTMQHWVSNMSGKYSYEYILSVDTTDPKLESYKNVPCDHLIINDNKNLIQASNKGAEISKGRILVLVSDDFECYKDWDIDVYKAMNPRNGIVLKTFDGVQKWIVTLPIMDRAYYEWSGYFYCPLYSHMFSDTDMTHLADCTGRLLVRNDLVFKHNHYSVSGKPKDEISLKADGTWNQGEEVYLNRVRNRFGIGADTMKLNEHARPHINWLKKKL